jgi:superfamily II DNA or RNA helicase
MPRFAVGSLVRCREREWVVLPSQDDDLLLLRPLGGRAAGVCGVFLPLEEHDVRPATFAPPDPAAMGDFESGALLRDAARLSLRSGAGPFRCMGRLGFRPRPYQIVPLLMALRLDPVRLLIADDVGIGKTIEAALIARELFDRGEIARMAVICPPHLCDQWQRELQHKFALEATVVRASTAAALERRLPRGDVSIWEHFPFTIVSIDYVKSERRRDSFLRAAPELIIVDEAHAAVGMGDGAQQQRYALVRDLAARSDRHLILLTATPHSGVEHAFARLIGLIDPEFAAFDLDHMRDAERDRLARHFVQRRRADVQRWLGSNDVTPFPQRESTEVTYALPRASAYRALFDDVFAFTREQVRADHASPAAGRASEAQLRWRRRARYWAALALLRCVMSSPAAAERALRLRAADVAAPLRLTDADDERFDADLIRPFVIDPTDQEQAHDLEPAQTADLFAETESGPSRSERARLERFAARAAALRGAEDPKLQRLIPLIQTLIDDGFNPIIYCRYIATADYVAAELARQFERVPAVRVMSVTGGRSEEERDMMIAELERSPRRILVATDCLSEGINLQHSFDAVVHYDLPWNPNRLEQREGRVDRYGQRSAVVRTVLLYGQDNPMDEAVMKVLLRKAVRIHKTLGISVPLPVDSGTVVEALIAALFQPAVDQLTLFDSDRQAALLDEAQELQRIELAWDRATRREQESRTRFAQRRIKPEEVARELEESDAALGDPAAVERFVIAACARLNVALTPVSGIRGATAPVFAVPLARLPAPVREPVAHLADADRNLLVTFTEPAPAGVEALERNHPLVVALADYLLETALLPAGMMPADAMPVAARSGVIRTRAVAKRTCLLLLRVRMLIEHGHQRDTQPLLAEELIVTGFRGSPASPTWLDQAEALALLETAQPAENLPRDARLIALRAVLDALPALDAALDQISRERALRLREAHMRVWSQVGGTQRRCACTPAGPPDILGVYVLLPVLAT